MKIRLNLAVHQSTHERYALFWAAPAGLGALVALVYLTTSALRTIREYNRVHRSVVECQAQQNALRDREMKALRRLQQPQYQRILKQASYVNSLIDRRQLSLTDLTAKLTRLLPADVRMTTLSLSEGGAGPFVRMTLESSNQEKVIAFVQNLEESPDFSDPVISSEDPGQESAQDASGGVARLICTAGYAGWQNPVVADGQKEEDSDEGESTPASPAATKATGAPKAPATTKGGSSKQRPQVEAAVGSKQKAVGNSQQ